MIIAHFSTKPQTLGMNAKGKFPLLFEVNVFPEKGFSVHFLTLECKAKFCQRPQKTTIVILCMSVQTTCDSKNFVENLNEEELATKQ